MGASLDKQIRFRSIPVFSEAAPAEFIVRMVRAQVRDGHVRLSSVLLLLPGALPGAGAPTLVTPGCNDPEQSWFREWPLCLPWLALARTTGRR
jgi:hypothetical protein